MNSKIVNRVVLPVLISAAVLTPLLRAELGSNGPVKNPITHIAASGGVERARRHNLSPSTTQPATTTTTGINPHIETTQPDVTTTTIPPTTTIPTTTTTQPPIQTTTTTTMPKPQPILPASGIAGPWNIVFDDEFSGSSLNTSNWSYCMSDGSCYNQYNVLQFTNQEYAVPQNCIVDNGLDLRVTTGNPDPKHPYNSCIIQTHGKFDFTYGYIEAKIDFPNGNDSWPSFWMLPSNAVVPPEIDIAEQIGVNTAPEENYYYANGAGGTGGYHAGRYAVTNPSGSFHTYAVDWEPGSITFYVDGKETGNYTSSTVTSTPMYIILTFAIDSIYPNPQVPQNMYVQYVRVWQHNIDHTGTS